MTYVYKCVHIHTYLHIQKKAVEAALMHKDQYSRVGVIGLGELMKMLFYKYKNLLNLFIEGRKKTPKHLI